MCDWLHLALNLLFTIFSARKRPYFGDVATDFTEIGAVAVEHHGEETPPLAVSFCKVLFIVIFIVIIIFFFFFYLRLRTEACKQMHWFNQRKKTLILQTSKNSHIFAVSDEDGYVSLFDSRRKLPSFARHRENAGLRACLWNACFGVFLFGWIFFVVSIILKFRDFFAEKARISDWVAHQNAIFDLCWIKVTTLVLWNYIEFFVIA